ncbi:MAG: hypothetical protein ACK4IA_16430 [Paracoccus hibiscisoli]|uniref:hypothetical protein n=1 Tax=Paracoccus hibiscisoli TaxID=2023261 RepID=UPI00391B8F24
MAAWTRKCTFEPDQDDWVVLRDGLVVGRVMRDEQQSSRLNRDQWSWSVVTMPARNGWSDTMAEALEKVRELASDSWGHEPHGWPDDR